MKLLGNVIFSNLRMSVRISRPATLLKLELIIYNIHIGWGALGGIIGELLNLVSLTIGIIRYRERRQKDK